MIRGFIFMLGLLILFIGAMDKVRFKEVATAPSVISVRDAAAMVEQDDEV